MRLATTKRTRGHKAAPAAPPAPALPPAPANLAGPDLLRRILLVLVVGLVVARPVVPGEDPGLLSELSEPCAPTLTLLTLFAGLAWTIWRLWARNYSTWAGLVEVGLALLAGLAFLSVGLAASYKRPAWLTAWEWVGLALTLFLVRQLSSSPTELRGLAGALLAGAVALSANAFLQEAHDLPRARETLAKNPDAVREMVVRRGPPDDRERAVLEGRTLRREASGPFFHPAALAGALALLLPGLVAAVVACLRGAAPRWLTSFATLFALAAGAALVCTRQLEPVVALLLVAAFCALFATRNWRFPLRASLALGVVALAGLTWLLYHLHVLAGPAAPWKRVWPAAWKMAEAHPWLGVGWENFGILYPRYLAPAAGPHEAAPHDWILETATNGGVFALAALVLAVAAFFYTLRRPHPAPPAPAPSAPEPAAVRWEFYLGGTLGLLLGFVMRVSASPVEMVIDEAVAAGLRVIAWFAAFALFERVPWSEGELRWSLGAGAAALLLTLTVAGSIAWTSLTGLVVIVLALGLSSCNAPPRSFLSRGQAVQLLPLPVLTAAVVGYFTFVLYPVASSSSALARALGAAGVYAEDVGHKREDRKLRDPRRFLRERVLDPLRDAERDDPDDARVRLYLADWTGVLWTLDPEQERVGRAAVEYAVHAQGLNPDSPEGFLAEARLRQRFADFFARWARKLDDEADDRRNKLPAPKREELRQVARKLRGRIQEQNALAAEAVGKAVERDPISARLRFLYAQALIQAGDAERGRDQARMARQVDAQATGAGAPGLREDEHEQIEKWLAEGIGR